MARTIATVSGVAIKPGVSRNRRLYTKEHIAGAVARAQERITGGMPLTQRTHHAAEDDSTRIAGRVTSLTVGEDGSARYTAEIADTEAGRTIASLLDTSDGRPPFLSGVSIRGAWDGRVRRERGPDGDPVETADGLTLLGIDYTASPGVPGAAVDTFAWAGGGASETTERVPITESVQEARVTITEDAPPEAVREAVEAARSLLPLERPHQLANGLCATCAGVAEAATVGMSKRGAGLQGKSGTNYADPGYQADKKQRYELDTAAHVRAAWAYISQSDNAKAYSAAQLKRIKGRIKAAAIKFGITIASEGWTVSPVLQVSEAVAEFYGGDPECAGSYSLSATNGPTTVTVCSYGLDPADLQAILAQACSGAGLALRALDPDMDADIDLPGQSGHESAEDPDTVAEASVPAAVTETAPVETPAPEPAAADRETEVPAMSETTTTEAVAPATAAAPAPAVTETDEQRIARIVDERLAAARPAAPVETVEQRIERIVSERLAARTAAPVETEDQRVERLVTERLTATRAAAPVVTETEDQRIERIVTERLVREKQELTAAGGGPGRKGLVTEHSAAAAAAEIPEGFPIRDGVVKPMEEWTDSERRVVGAQLERHVLGGRYQQ